MQPTGRIGPSSAQAQPPVKTLRNEKLCGRRHEVPTADAHFVRQRQPTLWQRKAVGSELEDLVANLRVIAAAAKREEKAQRAAAAIGRAGPYR